MGVTSDALWLAELFQRFGPVLHLRDLDAAGLPRELARRAEAHGALIRLAKAAFVQADQFRSLPPWQAFRLRAIGFGLCSGNETFLSGQAAAVILKLPVIGDPPSKVTAIRPGLGHRSPNRTHHGLVRIGHLPLAHRTTRDRVRTVTAGFAAVDIARHIGPRDGILAMDAALAGGESSESIGRLIEDMSKYPGVEAARWTLSHADGRSESPLESMGRMAFVSSGRPVPLSNVWITAGGGVYRVDHLLAECGVVIEADGNLKYNDRPDAAFIVTREKERERHLRDSGFEIVRYTFDMALRRPGEILQLVDRAIRRRNGAPVPQCWRREPGPRAGLRG